MIFVCLSVLTYKKSTHNLVQHSSFPQTNTCSNLPQAEVTYVLLLGRVTTSGHGIPIAGDINIQMEVLGSVLQGRANDLDRPRNPASELGRSATTLTEPNVPSGIGPGLIG